jgi:hypothetical protein
MLKTMTWTSTLETLTCCSCGVPYAAPESLLSARRKDGANFYCPNGHPQSSGNLKRTNSGSS